jgi:hypothetical protein
VIGSPGSGKTHFARRLASLTGLPLHHLDDYYWWEGWRRTPADEWPAVVAELSARPRWIIDGNYAPTLASRAARADAIVLFDVPAAVCLRGIAHRTLRIAAGHTEHLPLRVRNDSGPVRASHDLLDLLRLALTFRRSTRPSMLRLIEESAGDARVLRVRSRAQAEAALAALAAHATHEPPDIRGNRAG